MSSLGSCVEEYWDVLVSVAVLGLAIAISVTLSVAYNVVAAPGSRPVPPPAIEPLPALGPPPLATPYS
jgi:hypothetical protein